MKRVTLALAALLALAAVFAVPAHPQTVGGVAGFCGFARVMTPSQAQMSSGAAFQQMTGTAASQSPTIPTVLSGSIVGMTVTVLNGMISYRVDGVAPTALVGDQFGPNTSGISAPVTLVACGSDMVNFKFMNGTNSATPSIVNFRFYTQGA